uniref:Uncharacterized protein n=1 Tax=Rhizophora mucronata TaxID=61149 RepID=A0A2P2NSS1_RHIMU
MQCVYQSSCCMLCLFELYDTV